MEQKVKLLYRFHCNFPNHTTLGGRNAGIYVPAGSIGTVIKELKNGVYNIQFTIAQDLSGPSLENPNVRANDDSYSITIVKTMFDAEFTFI